MTTNIRWMQLQGIVVGLDNLDGVIRIIRESSSNAVARTGLRNGKLSMNFSFHP